MSHGSTIAPQLTFQEKMAIFHALEAKSGISCLSGRLRFVINEGKTAEFTEKEIRDIIKALELALKKSHDTKAECYGHLSLIELEELLGKIKKLPCVFQAKGA